jgi:hypothetical protein
MKQIIEQNGTGHYIQSIITWINLLNDNLSAESAISYIFEIGRTAVVVTKFDNEDILFQDGFAINGEYTLSDSIKLNNYLEKEFNNIHKI